MRGSRYSVGWVAEGVEKSVFGKGMISAFELLGWERGLLMTRLWASWGAGLVCDGHDHPVLYK